MRRWMIVAVMGLVWTGAASAQTPGEPQVYGGDYDPPPDLYVPWSLAYHPRPICFDEQEPVREEAWLANRAPALFPSPGKNVDGSWLQEAFRVTQGCKILLKDDPDCLIWSVLNRQATPYYPDLLNDLCFSDASSIVKVGPDMGPFFIQPTPHAVRFDQPIPQADPEYRDGEPVPGSALRAAAVRKRSSLQPLPDGHGS